MYNENVKNVVSTIIIIVCILILFQSHFLQKTRNGEFYGYYATLPKQELPNILTNYLRSANIPYSLYKMPNYVVDFLKYDKGFRYGYNSGKYMVVVFTGNRASKDYKSLDLFYRELDTLMDVERKHYTYIVRNEDKAPHFILDADNAGYRDLREYCKWFCVINPAKNTMFVFSHISDSEKEALGVLIQQYKYMSDK